MENEFELKDNVYIIGKLDAFKQFHLSRKIAPVIPSLVPVFVEISKKGDIQNNISAIAELLQPFADGLAALSDEHSEYVLKTCLGAVKRQTGETFTPVWDKRGNVCLFDDLDLGDMMQITVKVIQSSLGSFIQGLLMSQADSPTKE